MTHNVRELRSVGLCILSYHASDDSMWNGPFGSGSGPMMKGDASKTLVLAERLLGTDGSDAVLEAHRCGGAGGGRAGSGTSACEVRSPRQPAGSRAAGALQQHAGC